MMAHYDDSGDEDDQEDDGANSGSAGESEKL